MKPNLGTLVFDGNGKLFDARIQSIGKRNISLFIDRLIEKENSELPKLHIAIAPPKNMDRFEWFAEKVTEIGVSEITPIHCKHSERKELRLDRIEKILLGACKQSLKLTIPKLNDMVKIEQFVSMPNEKNQRFVAYCDEKARHLKNAYKESFDACIMIGPEGDFTKEEIQLAEKNGFESVSLGKSRLRLETAGVFAASIFNLANQS